MRVLDLFAGTGSSTRAFADAGHEVIRVEIDTGFDADLHANIIDINSDDLKSLGARGRYDFVWASPPCTAFSIAGAGAHWSKGYRPKTSFALASIELVWHTVTLINQVTAHDGYYVIENPRGMLRKLDPVMFLHRDTVWYCQYGDTRAKPTDLWNNLPATWLPQSCRNGADDHEAAPRGSKTGTQGLALKERSMVPYAVGESIMEAIEKYRSNDE